MRIRLAVESDLSPVVELDDVARQPDGARARFLSEQAATGQMLVAEDEHEIVGYVVHDRSFFERGFVHLLYVGVSHRRRGVGSALLAAAVGVCGTRRVFTSTNQSNTGMQALLNRSGWVPAGSVDGLDEGDPEVFFYIDAG